jgi:hypothetical protein
MRACLSSIFSRHRRWAFGRSDHVLNEAEARDSTHSIDSTTRRAGEEWKGGRGDSAYLHYGSQNKTMPRIPLSFRPLSIRIGP